MSTDTENSVFRATGLALLVAALSGCGFIGGPVKCEGPGEVATLQPREPIRVPDDLDNLDETKALKIPTATSPPPEEGKCLDQPPRFEASG